LLDPKQPLLSSCLPPKLAAATPLREVAVRPAQLASAALAAPAQKEIAVAAPAGTTINITIKVG
jgi:hypothetical protein